MPQQEQNQRDIQRYLDGIESQHRDKPRYMATLRAMLEKVDGAHMETRRMPEASYIRNASGAQLDEIGAQVGASRSLPEVALPDGTSTLDDEAYRSVILAQIVQNQWDGTYGHFREIWDANLTDVITATFYDNQDMTLDVRVEGRTETVLTYLMRHGYIIPKAMGVAYNIIMTDTHRLPLKLAMGEAHMGILRERMTV